jgi:hypothetical protein
LGSAIGIGKLPDNLFVMKSAKMEEVSSDYQQS